MAKTVKCAFCGKEMKAGFLGIFGSESEDLKLGEVTLNCCPECYAKYGEFAKREGKRIGTKLENICFDGKFRLQQVTLPKDKITQLFLQYMEQSKAYAANEDYSGFFMVLEPTKDSPVNTFLAAEDLVVNGEDAKDWFARSQELLAEEAQRGLSAERNGKKFQQRKPWAFSGADISCIEYACGIETLLGDSAGMRITVKLNDFHQMTYKPCIISGYITYKNSLLNQKKYRDAQITAALTALRTALGAEHLPIVEVQKIK